MCANCGTIVMDYNNLARESVTYETPYITYKQNLLTNACNVKTCSDKQHR